MSRTIFIFGLGYVGRPLGHLLARKGWTIRGTTRAPERLQAAAAAGWQTLLWSLWRDSGLVHSH